MLKKKMHITTDRLADIMEWLWFPNTQFMQPKCEQIVETIITK